ncbi:6-pyruvoyl-tetrahydropterin synthase-related protein [Synechococcus sp. PCC 7336]|uniref:6-pyruvoyl-tetrahydropterin synthase-related protein n=1 Tax=Synechococcus sp. PCC 7336 TaxID=195250 RepID=UPI00034DB205|nr:6-pyruvoyl-tetrahydropterin synthase-related protein [Synechococcus sp. PCC 7336]
MPGRFLLRGSLAAAIAAGLAVLLTLPMLQQGYPLTHSTHFNLSWAFQYQAQMAGGQWYPRWLEYSNFGFGNATFAFYPPLCMVATVLFRALGSDLPQSLIGSMGLAIFVFGLGLYRYGRCFYPRWIAAIAATLAIAMPYFLANIYWRGSLAETWGIAFLPWVLWASQRVVDRPRDWGRVGMLALAYGCLALSHLPTLLLFSIGWVMFPWLVSPRSQRPEAVQGNCLGGLLAVAWTAFYLWPVLRDRHFVQIDWVNALADYRPQNRLMLKGLLSLQPQFADHWFDRTLLPFWGVAVAIVLFGAVVYFGTALRSRHPHRDRADPIDRHGRIQRAARYWLLLSALAILMTTDLLSWTYDFALPLQRIQFSWRWLVLLCVTLPMLLGYGLEVAAGAGQSRAVTAVSGSFVLLLAIATLWQAKGVIDTAAYDAQTMQRFATLAAAKQFPQEPGQPPGQPFLYWHWIYADGMGLVDVWEYRAQPVSMSMPPDRSHPLVEWQDGSTAGLQTELWDYGRRSAIARNATAVPKVMLVRTFYYPGWHARLDGDRISTEATAFGQIQVTIPAGVHRVDLTYAGTTADGVGRAISAGTVVAIAAAKLLGLRRRRRSLQPDRSTISIGTNPAR